METIEDVLMVTTVMEHSRFFCYMAKQIESHKGITNIRTVEKVMPQQISSNGFAGGCFLTYAVFGGISPLTCTHFDPNIFLIFSKSNFVHTSPTDDCRQPFIFLRFRWCRYLLRVHREILQYEHTMRNVKQKEKPANRH